MREADRVVEARCPQLATRATSPRTQVNIVQASSFCFGTLQPRNMPVTHFKHVNCLTTPKSWLVSGRMSSADSESNSVLTEVEIDDFGRSLVTPPHGLGTSDEAVIPTALRGVGLRRLE